MTFAWGQFDHTLKHFRGILDALSEELPLIEAIFRGILAFNEFPTRVVVADRQAPGAAWSPAAKPVRPLD